MMLNNRGFAISTVLYSMLVMATLIMFLLIGHFSFERDSTSDFVNDIKAELNGSYSGSASSNVVAVNSDDTVSGSLVDINGDPITVTDKFKIVSSVNDSYVINIENNAISTNDANVNIFINDNVTGQEFGLTNADNQMNYYITPYSVSNYVFDILDNSDENEKNIRLYTKNNNDGQKWRFVETGNKGVYYIKSLLNTCINIDKALIGNNTNINSYACNESGAQKWKFIKL